jgi:hypothetical protein
MSKETNGKPKEEERPKAIKRRVFKDFAEYWHLVKPLSPTQREVLVQSLSMDERRSLHASFQRGGWNDLMMRNNCDQILNVVKKKLGVDFLEVRMKVVFGKPQLIQRGFWEYINRCFDNIPWEHISYIFDGIVAEEYDQDYLKLSFYKN